MTPCLLFTQFAAHMPAGPPSALPQRPLVARPVLVWSLLLGSWLAPASVNAELVFFSSGRSLSVKGHRQEGNLLVLSLRGGGEVASDASLILRIVPDEVPYPEPAPDSALLAERGGARGTLQLVSDPRYDGMIQRAADRHGIDVRLVRAVIQVESGYQREARSPRGAMGLMQLMPQTARQYGVRNAFDPRANIDAGTRHLKMLLGQFPLKLALAAYNAGEAAVERFQGVPPYPETEEYVARVLQLLGS